jgi:outer membrane protein OmpA-like peptidoglycan-associated protein
MRLPAPINLPGYTTTQPSIGYDKELEAPVLWFASDRPGGKGGLDLWYVPLDTNFFCPCNLPLPGKKFAYVPEFDAPVNVADLNTPENDVSPFFFAPTQKLFFSSDGRPGLGGYDIFFAEKSGDSFSAVQNAGAGLNSSYNDLYFFLKPDGANGYLSSNRPGAFYLDDKKKVPCHDIFSFKLPVPETPLPPFRSPNDSSSYTTAKIPPPPPATEELPPAQPPKLEDFSGLPLYFDNDEPDKRTRRTTTKLNYEETVEKYLKRQGEYKTKFAGGAKGEKAEKAAQEVDDFFDLEVRRGAERLYQLCEILLVRLAKGERIEVLIKGFTSPRAESDYNLNLGKRRVSSVRNFFAAWGEGALLPYLNQGSLSLQEVSFGETAARSHVSDKLTDERNSIYNPDAARERRVEIVEVRTKKE